MDTISDKEKRLKDFERELREIDERNWKNLSAEELKWIEGNLKDDQLRLADEMKTLQMSLDEHLKNNELSEFNMVRQKIRRKRRQYNHLSDNKARTFYARQDKIIENGMEETLTKKGAQILNYIVLFFIFVVLGILIFEMFFYDYEELKTSGWLFKLFVIDLFACGVFLFEFCLGWHHAENNGWYWRHHWIDLVSSIPVPYPGFLNIERWGRLLRLIRVFRLWRAMRIVAFAFRGIKRLQKSNIRIIELSIAFIVIITIIGSAVIIQLEGDDLVSHMDAREIETIQTDKSGPEKTGISSAQRFEEGIWWTLTTVTTGGFADLYEPKTLSARVLTAFLILVGASLIAVFTATVTSLFIGEEAEELRDTQDALLGRHAELVESLGKLQISVRALNDKLS